MCIRDRARACRIDAVEIFGSVARGEDREGSDLDLLVTPATDATLFDFAAFRRSVAQLLGVDVDVVSRRALLPHDQDVLNDAVAL